MSVVDYIINNGGTVIMAALFVWMFVQDKKKNTKTLEDNTKALQTLAESESNIAKSLDIIQSLLMIINEKVDKTLGVKKK